MASFQFDADKYDVIVLDHDLNVIAIIDDYIELLWVERYDDAGEFSIYVQPSERNFELFSLNTMLVSPFSDKIMVVTRRELVTDSDEGHKFLIKGISFEGLMKRRIDRIVNIDPVLNPPNRAVDPFVRHVVLNVMTAGPSIFDDIGYRHVVYAYSTDQRIIDAKISYNIEYQQTFSAVQGIARTLGLGFKFHINLNKEIEFNLYRGLDRSLKQDPIVNDYVIFSPEYENLLNSNYQDSNETYANFARGYHEDIGMVLSQVRTTDPNYSGISTRPFEDGWDRYEVKVDAIKTPSGTYTMAIADVIFSQFNEVKIFDGEVDPNGIFKLNQDFFLGDMVEVRNEFNIGETVRLTEIATTVNSEGVLVVPTFAYLTGQYEPTWSERLTVATPRISPNGGSFESSQTVSILCDTSGAAIFYTTNGSNPTTNSTYYTGPFQIQQSAQIRAIAVKNNMNDSDVALAVFTLLNKAPRPTTWWEYRQEGLATYISSYASSSIPNATYHYRNQSPNTGAWLNWLSNTTGILGTIAFNTGSGATYTKQVYVTAPGYTQSDTVTMTSRPA